MQIFEDMPGLKLTATSVSMAYNVIEAGGLDQNAVKAALLNYAPVSNAPPGATYAWPRRALQLEETGPDTWKATITWSALTYQYSLKIGGQQQQVRCDKEVVNTYGTNVPTLSAKGQTGAAIGWDGRTVHGCSIYVPQKTWTENVEIPISDFSFDYEDLVYQVQLAPVNLTPFRGHAPGAVIFLGMQVQLSTQNPDSVSASYEFSATPNNSAADNTLLTIGALTDIAKDGWDYLEVNYTPQVDTNQPLVVPTPQNVIIHRVYDRSPFEWLNIGTGRALPLWQGAQNLADMEDDEDDTDDDDDNQD